jgi:diadenosine tetraphosphate (Ap4A) HIT family hydrolase
MHSADDDSANRPEHTCPFCSIEAARVAFQTDEFRAIFDAFPVTEGHLLIVPQRHVSRWDDLSVTSDYAHHP